jgi:uncharacterized coiled-coil protein SlyX
MDLEKRIIELEIELKKANKKINSLMDWSDRIDDNNDKFNGYF